MLEVMVTLLEARAEVDVMMYYTAWEKSITCSKTAG